jgi:hypothetical protein
MAKGSRMHSIQHVLRWAAWGSGHSRAKLKALTVLFVHTPPTVAPLPPASNSSRGAHVKLWTLSPPEEDRREGNRWLLLHALASDRRQENVGEQLDAMEAQRTLADRRRTLREDGMGGRSDGVRLAYTDCGETVLHDRFSGGPARDERRSSARLCELADDPPACLCPAV